MVEVPSQILVVDDDATVPDVVARYLRRDGYAVDTGADGREALDRALAEPPTWWFSTSCFPGSTGSRFAGGCGR